MWADATKRKGGVVKAEQTFAEHAPDLSATLSGTSAGEAGKMESLEKDLQRPD